MNLSISSLQMAAAAVAASGSLDASGDSENQGDPAEERVINEEYKIWKKNTPFLYDLVSSYLYSHAQFCAALMMPFFLLFQRFCVFFDVKCNFKRGFVCPSIGPFVRNAFL